MRKFSNKAEEYVDQNKKRSIWKKAATVAAGMVVFCTTYALILPAITKERPVFCGFEETHTHDKSCYVKTANEQKIEMVCSLDNSVAHTHDDSCKDAEGNLICTLPEIAQHIHTDSCYAEMGTIESDAQTESVLVSGHTHSDACYTMQRGDLICQTAEGAGHTHTDACRGRGALICSIPENHVHGDGCYTAQRGDLICGQAESAGHSHGSGCYDEAGGLICGQAEAAAHTHGDDCYSVNKTLACGIQEGHVHSDSCYESAVVCGQTEASGHTHGDDCYAWNKVLTCGQEETPDKTETRAAANAPAESKEKVLICTEPTAQVHVHSDACFKTVQDSTEQAPLTCEKEEGEDHKHEEYCYGDWELVCEKEEHEHDLSCYSDPEADVETAEDWEKTFEDAKLNGVWAHDVLLIAESQLDYHESTDNYEVEEDGKTINGYTRYGAWYGMPYEEWCAMFASFCLHYAEVEDMPLEAGCPAWIEKLSQPKYDLYEKADEYTPVGGDLIFFDWDGDNVSDHVGIVAEVIPASDSEPEKVKTIEGNSSKQVKYNTYKSEDEQIMGYGKLPVQDGGVYDYSDDQVQITAEFLDGSEVARKAVLEVTSNLEGSEAYETLLQQAELAAGEKLAKGWFYDLGLTIKYEKQEQKEAVSAGDETVKVTLRLNEKAAENPDDVIVFGYMEDGTPAALSGVTVSEEQNSAGETVTVLSFQTSGLNSIGVTARSTEAPVYTYADENLQAEVELPRTTSVPAAAVLKVTAIEAGSERYEQLAGQAASAVSGEITQKMFYDIRFYTEDGEYIPADDHAKVTMTFAGSTLNAPEMLAVLHYDENDGAPAVLENVRVTAQTAEETAGSEAAEAETEAADGEAAETETAGSEVTAAETEAAETDTNTALQLVFEMDGISAIGLAELQDAEEKSGLYIYSDEQIYVEVQLPEDTDVPADAILSVVPVEADHENYAGYVDQAEQAVGAMANIALYDISFYTADGTYIPVSDNAKVSMAFVNSPVDVEAEIQVLHFKEEAEAPQTLEIVDAGKKEIAVQSPNPEEQIALYAEILDAEETEPMSISQTEAAESETAEAQQEAAAGETEAAGENAPEEAVTEVRTVVEFVTDGFSTFAVIEVASGDTIMTRSLYDANVQPDASYENLAGKTVVISTWFQDNEAYYALASKDDAAAAAMDRAKVIHSEDNSLIYVDKTNLNKQLWILEGTETRGVYYIKSKATGRYLQICSDDAAAAQLIWKSTPDTNCAIRILRQNNKGFMVLRRENNQNCYLIYDPGSQAFTAVNNGDVGKAPERSSMLISEYAEPIDNLGGQSVAIVGVKDLNNPVAVTSSPGANPSRLQHRAVSWAADDRTEIEATGEGISWRFTTVDAALGQYYIQDNEEHYLNIGDATATAAAENPQQIITVTAAEIDGVKYVSLSASVDGTTYYLNQYGGDLTGGNYMGFAGWTDGAVNDAGSRFILAHETAFKATVISRADLRSIATRPYAQLIVFVRQIDAYGDAHYYAVNADGSAVELYLASDELKDGAVMYVTADDPKIRWDATGSAKDGWGSAQYEVNTQINLQYKNIDTGEYLLPNMVGESSNIISPNDPTDNRPLYWGEKPSPVIAVTAPQDVTIDTDIAHMVVANPTRNIDGADETKRLTYVPAENKFGVEEIENIDGPKVASADQSNVFYFAVIDTSNIVEEEISEDKNLVGQILSREEFQDAASEYGNEYPFMIIAEKDGKYFALDAYGAAQPVALIAGDSLEAGGRFIFQTSDSYNANRILWNPYATKMDNNAENDEDGWVDLWLANVATKQYLSPTAAGLTASVQVKGDHTPGFYYKEGGIVSYIDCDQNSSDATKYYRLGFDDDGNFTVLKGWGGDGTNDQNNNFADSENQTKFYVAMLVDRNVTVGANNAVSEYQKISGVAENAKMYLFNYGSAIDYYGRTYNGTQGYTVDGKENLIYRFFHRPSFKGQAIDGTNEDKDEYATNDVFQNYPLQFGRTLLDGVPYINLSAANSGVTTNWTDTNGASLYSLGYLFDWDKAFVQSSTSLTLSQTNGDDWQAIKDEPDTVNINNNGGTTAPATEYDPITNPNYAVQRFEVSNNGEGTGLFQIDSTTGNYYYDSALNAAWYNPTTQKMELYDYAIVPSGSLACIGGNFLPFNLGHEDGRLVETNNGWIKEHKNGINDRTYQLNGFQQDDDVTIGRGSMTDLWMGMYIELKFTMTDDGKLVPKDANGNPIGAEQDMIFDFTGDDDVLIYVDDVLVLDISGIHGAESANINFATGVVDSPKLKGNFEEVFAAAGRSDLIDKTTKLLKPWTEHTLKFFYLERGGNISNCRISYNLDYIPTGDLTVSKEVEGIGAGEEYYGTYEFGLQIESFGDMSTTTGNTYPISYEIVDEKGTSLLKNVIYENAAGVNKEDIIKELNALTFTLKDKQTAKFYGFPEGTKLQVVEKTATAGQGIRSAAFRVEGSETSQADAGDTASSGWISDTLTISSANPQNCKLACKNTLDPVKLTIQKELLENNGNQSEDAPKEFEFTYVVTKPDGTTMGPETVKVTSGTPKVIGEDGEIPFGSKIQVTEVSSAGYQVSWKYETKNNQGTASSASGTGSQTDEVKLVADITVTFTNTKGYELPESGGTGTHFYTLWGFLLTAVPLMYGYSQRRKRERRSA